MKIVSITAQAIDCGFQSQKLQTSRVASPMSRFPRFAAERASWMWPTKKVFVRAEDADGTVGWSCTNGGEIVALIVTAQLARLLEGERVEIAESWAQMKAALLPNDRSGFAMMAVAGVDIALWDLAARRAGRGLVDLLGGARAGRLPVYATTARPEALAGQGWHGLKAAAPYGPEAGEAGLAENIALLRRFAEAAGPGRSIMIDAFMAWDADYALRFAEAAAGLPLKWIEDPLPPDDIDGLIRLRGEMDPGIKLALGNFAFSLADCRELLRYGLADILQPDIAWAGGITEGLRILDLAAEADTPVILHNSCEQPWALALAAARQSAPTVEFVDRGDDSPLYALSGPRPEIDDGFVTVPTGPLHNRPPSHIAAAFGDQT
ncbi:paral putative galactonate dehydratase [Oceanicola granulosus HTCC2516]|uniref:Paral putative galactonate dehydratase n=1 Tax=Oceanicola granulosus (strain ATCC BAA-861 / DSM 15982 / KCTC 12143 / HTCC2516) TaxID=314256 RepID=Q2CGS7_OCEGH|nr:enolase C-terminal domain-like protein [Oceanicola granulosus]EAR51858.1 paral putative galactonate dehydratase [Oceanicola granulosus HTCC2516]